LWPIDEFQPISVITIGLPASPLRFITARIFCRKRITLDGITVYGCTATTSK